MTRHWRNLIAAMGCVCLSTAISFAQTPSSGFPRRVPPKRSSQIQNGFGINSDLPRPPYLPWDRWWWTRMFDAGVNWIRIGQYENKLRIQRVGTGWNANEGSSRLRRKSTIMWTRSSKTASRFRCNSCTATRCTRDRTERNPTRSLPNRAPFTMTTAALTQSSGRQNPPRRPPPSFAM